MWRGCTEIVLLDLGSEPVDCPILFVQRYADSFLRHCFEKYEFGRRTVGNVPLALFVRIYYQW